MSTAPYTKTLVVLWGLLVTSALLALVIFAMVPVTDTVIRPTVWPTEQSPQVSRPLAGWKASVYRKRWTHDQNFPVGMTPIGQSPAPINVNLSELRHERYWLGQANPAFYARVERLIADISLGNNTDASKRELKDLMNFQPLVEEKDMAVFLFTLKVFAQACQAANLTWFLVSGSALGAVRHHGMIPWDDDIDILVNSSRWATVRDVLANVQGFDLYAPGNMQWKFYLSSLPPANKPFRWPNLDIFFFAEDEEHIWSLTRGAQSGLADRKTDVFPLATRKFGILQVPVARKIESIVAKQYRDFQTSCSTANFVHKTNVARSPSSLVRVDCRKLHRVFPFVFNVTQADGTVVEQLKIDGKVV